MEERQREVNVKCCDKATMLPETAKAPDESIEPNHHDESPQVSKMVP